MGNETNNAIVPRLRFPEFQDAGEWESMQLSKLGQTFGGLTGKSANDFDSGKPYVTYKQIFNDSRVDVSKCGFVTIATNENQNSLQYGDVLFTMSSETPDEIGYASVVLEILDEPIYLNSFCFAFRPFCLNSLRPEFSRYLFHSPIYRKTISELAQGITRYNISKTNFSNLELPIPSKTVEQNKIADCFFSIDDIITTQTQKIEVLKAHKKGLMQQLFPEKGETVPKLRFSEFQNKGEWREKTLGNFIESYRGGAPLTPSDFVTNSNYEIIPKKAINEGMWLNIENSTYCTEEFYKNNEQSVVDKTHLITTLRDLVPTGPTIGYIVKYNSEKIYILAQGVYGIKLKDTLVPDFLIHFSNTNKYRKLINAIMVGSTQVHVRNGDFFKIPICIPSRKEEQQKIANCLSSLDDLITAQSRKIETLKAHKKGLMQQLFPNTNDAYK